MDAEKLGQLAANARERRAAAAAADERKLAEQMARNFPGLDDWQQEVADCGGLKEWRAGMWPQIGREDEPPMYTLASPFVDTAVELFPGVRERVELHGPRKDHLLVLALLYAKEQTT